MKKTIFTSIFVLFMSFSLAAQNGNTWIKKSYSISGDWSLEKSNGKTYLVLGDNFKTSKGPDLKLFITKKSAEAVKKNDAVETYGVFVGELTSSKGKQKYVLPNNLNINDFKSIVIHCEKYTKVWGAANI